MLCSKLTICACVETSRADTGSSQTISFGLSAIALAEELETYKRESIISEACRDLADTQTEKLKGLVESIDFESEEEFTQKIATIKESYFAKEIVEQTNEAESLVEEADEEVEVSSVMEHYLTTLRKTSKK